MPERVTANELVEFQDLTSKLEKLNTSLKGIVASLKDVQDAMVKTYTETNKVIKSKDQLATNTKKATDQIKKQTDVEKEIAKKDEEHYKILTKIIAQKDKDYKKTQDKINQLKEKNKTQEQENKLNSLAIGSYDRISLQLTMLRGKYKSLSDEQRNSPMGKKMLTDIVKLDDKLKNFDSSLGVHGRFVGIYGDIWKKVSGVFIAFGGFIATGMAAIRGWNAVISKSESLSDKWAKTTEGLKTGLDYIVKRLTSGTDFNGFWKGLKEAADAGRQFAEVMDEMEDRRVALSFKEIDARYEYVKLNKVIRDGTKSQEERKKAAQDLINLENKLALERKEISENENQATINRIATQNSVTEEQVRLFIKQDKNFLDNLEGNADRFDSNLLSAQQKVSDQLSGYAPLTAIIQAQRAVADKMEKNDPIGKSFSDLRKRLGNITKSEKDEIIKAYSEMNDALTDFEQKTTRAQIRLNDLLSDEDTNSEKRSENFDEWVRKSNEAFDKNQQATKDFYNETDKRFDQSEDKKRKELKNWVDDSNKAFKENQEANQKFYDEVDKRSNDSREKERKRFLERKEEEEELKQIKQEALNTTFQLFNTLYQGEISRIEEKKRKEIEAAGDNAKAKENIEKKYDRKIADVKRKQAIADKLGALFNIGINTAVNITKTPLLAPWLKILGLLQAAIVLATPIPKFFKGVRNFKGGVADVAEQGSEMIKTKEGRMFLTPEKATRMVLPEGSDVFTHAETEKMLMGGAQPEKFDTLIREQRLTRKMLASKPTKSLNITPSGWKETTRIANTVINHVDKYFRK